jgi:hypothetical protein
MFSCLESSLSPSLSQKDNIDLERVKDSRYLNELKKGI